MLPALPAHTGVMAGRAGAARPPLMAGAPSVWGMRGGGASRVQQRAREDASPARRNALSSATASFCVSALPQLVARRDSNFDPRWGRFTQPCKVR
jgi:hypothetical protein